MEVLPRGGNATSDRHRILQDTEAAGVRDFHASLPAGVEGGGRRGRKGSNDPRFGRMRESREGKVTKQRRLMEGKELRGSRASK